jgi:hypothetical protein
VERGLFLRKRGEAHQQVHATLWWKNPLKRVDRSENNAVQQGLAPPTRGEAAAASARHPVLEETIEAVWSEAARSMHKGLAPSTRGEAAAASARHPVVEEIIEAVWSEATRKID